MERSKVLDPDVRSSWNISCLGIAPRWKSFHVSKMLLLREVREMARERLGKAKRTPLKVMGSHGKVKAMQREVEGAWGNRATIHGPGPANNFVH